MFLLAYFHSFYVSSIIDFFRITILVKHDAERLRLGEELVFEIRLLAPKLNL
jgi:hypothetical protein